MKPIKLITSAFVLLFTIQVLAADTPHEQIQLLINEGHLQQALKLADETLARDESDIRMLFLKGLVLTRLNDLDKAQAVFEKLTTEHPELPEPFNNLAVIYAFKGEYDKAELALLTAINTHPSYATAHENLGDIYAKMATQAYNQALALDQENKYVKEKLLLVNELFSVPETPLTVVEKGAQPEPPVKTDEPVAMEKPKEKITAEVATPAVEVAEAEKSKQADDTRKDEVIAALKAWAGAWSSQDVAAYLASYSDDFTTPGNVTRKAWDAQRKVRLEKPQFIKVNLSSIKVSIDDKGNAHAGFLQQYQSDTYGDRVRKEVLMVKRNGKWLIENEVVK